MKFMTMSSREIFFLLKNTNSWFAQIKSALFHSTLFSFGCLQYTVVANIFKELFKFSVLIFLLLKFAHTWISSIWRLCRKWLSTIVACVESWCDLLAKGQWTYLLPDDIELASSLCFYVKEWCELKVPCKTKQLII